MYVKNELFSGIDLKALEIVTCHWGGWVSKVDVTILELYFTTSEDQVGVDNR